MLLAVVVAAVVAVCTIGGMAVGLLAGTADFHQTTLGGIETRSYPSLDGHVSVYVPLVDWRVRLLDHRAPVHVELELRGIDRAQAGEGISSSNAISQSLGDLRRDSEQVVEQAVRRAALASAVGGLAGAIVAGALITSTRLRRRWLLLAPLLGVALIAGVLVPSVRALESVTAQDVQVTATGYNAQELPTVLRFASQLLDVGDEYERHYETALQSISNLASFAGASEQEPDERAFVISDFHDNVFVLDALDAFTGDSTVFAVGDFIQVGARVEQRTAPQVAQLGGRVVAVSGNHDTPQYMQALADAGADVLDADEPTTTFGDLLVAGYPDPLERKPASDGEHRLRVYGAEYQQQIDDVLAWWDEQPARPDVVLVHQHGFAHAIVKHLQEIGDTKPLLVLTGHDHKAHVHAKGPHVIVDAGTLGAGGLAAIGEQPASFASLDLVDGTVVAVHLIAVEPLTGRATSERVEIPKPR